MATNRQIASLAPRTEVYGSLKGRYHPSKFTVESWMKAIESFDEANRTDLRASLYRRSPRLERALVLGSGTWVCYGRRSGLRRTVNPLRLRRLPDCVFVKIVPATPDGRIDDFAELKSNPAVFYVETATGGLWKTVNQGTTFALDLCGLGILWSWNSV